MSELEDASHPVAPDAGSEICQNSKIEKGWKADQEYHDIVGVVCVFTNQIDEVLNAHKEAVNET